MEFLRKYGVGCVLDVPIIKRGVVDFAVAADWTPATGDVKVSKDGGAFANIGTLPTALGSTWQWTLSATEMQAARLAVVTVDSATKAVEDQQINLATYGHANALHEADLDAPLASAAAVAALMTAAAGVALASDVTALLGFLPEGIKKNQAFDNFSFHMRRAINPAMLAPGLTVTAQRKLDAGVFAPCTNAVVEVSDGFYRINLSAADLNGDIVTLLFTAPTADNTTFVFTTS